MQEAMWMTKTMKMAVREGGDCGGSLTQKYLRKGGVVHVGHRAHV